MPDWIEPQIGIWEPDRIPLQTFSARSVALRAAVTLIADSAPSAGWHGRAPIEVAEQFERWLLRPVEKGDR